MESDDSLPVFTAIEFGFQTLTPSTLGQPIKPVVNFLSPPSIPISSNPASPDAQSDTVSTTQGLSSITVCSNHFVTADQLQPPPLRFLLRTLEPRFHLPAMHAPNPKGYFSMCNNTPAETMTTIADLPLPDNITESTSVDWREL